MKKEEIKKRLEKIIDSFGQLDDVESYFAKYHQINEALVDNCNRWIYCIRLDSVADFWEWARKEESGYRFPQLIAPEDFDFLISAGVPLLSFPDLNQIDTDALITETGEGEEDEAEIMKYYINYHTGAGNEIIAGTLEEAKKNADENAAYTQADITIHSTDGDEPGEIICRRSWWGVEYDPDAAESEEGDSVITFGNFGYYGPWRDE